MITVDLDAWGTAVGIAVGVIVICGTIGGGLVAVCRMLLNGITKLDTRIDGLETKIERLDTKLDTKVDGLETKIERLDTKVDTKIEGVRGDLTEGFAALRSELQGVRVDVSALEGRVYDLIAQREPRAQ